MRRTTWTRNGEVGSVSLCFDQVDHMATLVVVKYATGISSGLE